MMQLLCVHFELTCDRAASKHITVNLEFNELGRGIHEVLFFSLFASIN